MLLLQLYQVTFNNKTNCCSRNPGIETFAECYPIAADDIPGQCKVSKDIKADFVFIGPEIPLVLGLKDELSKLGISAFGPSKKAAQLEVQKLFLEIFVKDIIFHNQNLNIVPISKLPKNK